MRRHLITLTRKPHDHWFILAPLSHLCISSINTMLRWQRTRQQQQSPHVNGRRLVYSVPKLECYLPIFMHYSGLFTKMRTHTSNRNNIHSLVEQTMPFQVSVAERWCASTFYIFHMQRHQDWITFWHYHEIWIVNNSIENDIGWIQNWTVRVWLTRRRTQTTFAY